MAAMASVSNISIANSTAKMVDDEDETPNKGCCHRLSCFRSVKFFACVLAVLACVNGAIAASYLPSVLTTIEQRFQLDSSMSGLIVSSYEIGATIAVIFVSYMGHHGHIPLIIGWGTLLIAIGSAVFSVPHFISPVYSGELLQDNMLGNSSGSGSYNFNKTNFCGRDAETEDMNSSCTKTTFSENRLYIAIFILAQTLIGIGSSPILTIGLSYIDNFVKKSASAQYIGEFIWILKDRVF